MNICDLYTVSRIGFEDIKPWLLHKHYAHRIPSISYSFGLFIDNELQAVCSFGHPVAHTLVKNVLGGEYQENIMELNRLCANEGLPRNTLSYFVSQCLKQLPPPHANCLIRRYFTWPSRIYLSGDKLDLYGIVSAIQRCDGERDGKYAPFCRGRLSGPM